jgi:hypothetical protein
MKQFQLLRKANDAVLTKFHVIDCASGSIVGSINVASEDAADLQKHWLGSAAQPQAAALTRKDAAPTKKNALAAAMEATRRPGALPPDHARQQENPAVAAMLRASKKNTLSAAAILRGC